jgi:uncharacterized protein (TIGR02285 family)
MQWRWILAAPLLLVLPARCFAAQTVTWMSEDLPPVYIYRGPFAGEGIGDLSVRFLIDHLPEYQHRMVRADTPRIFYEMAHKDGICYWGAWRTVEREAFAVFSNRLVPGPAFRVIIDENRLADFRPFLSGPDEIDLSRLASSDKLAGGYVSGQPYPGVIGAFIDNPQRKTLLSQVTQVSQLYSLLNAERVSFIIGNGVETSYYMSRLNGNRAFHPLRIKDGPPATAGYVACSKGPLGTEVIAKIDRLLSDDTVWARYLQPLLRWGDQDDYAAGLAVKPE